MTYEFYRYVFIGGAAASCAMLVVSILVFVFLRIPKVIGDLSGANAKRAIENIRIKNENTGEKTYKSSIVNQNRGKLTDKISPSGRLIKVPANDTTGAMSTSKIGESQGGSEAAANETTVLSMPLSADGTTVLSAEPVAAPRPIGGFVITRAITFIHTDEIIP